MRKWLFVTVLLITSLLFANPVFAEGNSYDKYAKESKETGTIQFSGDNQVTNKQVTSNVDLEPYKPSSWGDKLIVTKTKGQRYSDTSFSPDDELFVSSAFDNNGTTNSPYATFPNQIYVDDTVKLTLNFVGIVDITKYYTSEDRSIGKLSAGTHTIKMVLDSDNVINESNENNNEYSITINIGSQQPVIISVSPKIVNINKGDTQWLSATTTPSNATITYQSDNNSVATVSRGGLITATGIGSTTIRVTASATGYNNGTDTVAVIVSNPTSNVDLEPYKPRDWGDKLIVTKTKGQRYSDTSFSPDDELFVSYAYDNNGTTDAPYATIQNKIYVDGTVKFTSSFQGIVNITDYFYGADRSISNLSAGTHTIKMVLDSDNVINESNENNNEYSITINVGSQQPVVISVSPKTVNLNKDETQWLTTTTTPSNSTITYQSDNNSVATVSRSGLITATGVGSTTIRVTASATGYNNGTATVAVTVSEEPSVNYLEVTSSDPEDGDSDVPVTKTITITFDTTIEKGDLSSIVLSDSNDNEIPVRSNVKGDTLTIVPTKSMLMGTDYTLNVPEEAVVGVDGKVLDSPYELSFTTITLETLELDSIDPDFDEEDVPVDKAIILTFTDKIKKGSNIKGIVLEDSDSNTVAYKSTIKGNRLTIKPTKPLQPGTTYNLYFPNDAITGSSGGNLNEDIELSFTTQESTPLEIESSDPEDGESDVPISKTIVVTFSEKIKKGSNIKGIFLEDSDFNTVTYKYTISGCTLKIKPSKKLLLGTDYTLTIPQDAVTGSTGTLLEDDYELYFTTVE